MSFWLLAPGFLLLPKESQAGRSTRLHPAEDVFGVDAVGADPRFGRDQSPKKSAPFRIDLGHISEKDVNLRHARKGIPTSRFGRRNALSVEIPFKGQAHPVSIGSSVYTEHVARSLAGLASDVVLTSFLILYSNRYTSKTGLRMTLLFVPRALGALLSSFANGK